MRKKVLMLFSVFTFLAIGMGTTCTDETCAVWLPSSLEQLQAAIDETPALKNPALYVHYEAAMEAADNGDMEGAIKELDKFMNIGCQKKYAEVYDLFLNVEQAFWWCYISIEEYEHTEP